jgi:rhamnose transport system permease protein
VIGRLSSRPIVLGLALATLALVLAVRAPAYFSDENLEDLFLSNAPILVVALGATLVIITGGIDISVGSVYAIAGVAAGAAAKVAVPQAAVPIALVTSCLVGAAAGALNGAVVAYGEAPSIVVTLATMVALRDGLRWVTDGGWIDDLPVTFQWLGFSQTTYPIALGVVVLLVLGVLAWGLRHVHAGRMIFAVGSSPAAARLAAIDVAAVRFWVFVLAGALTGLAAVLNAVRFNQIPSNSGIGLEMKVIAAVVVGGTAITGGRGTLAGTVLGVVLLGAIGPALTFLGLSAYWERAVEGAVILIAVAIEASGHLETGRRLASRHA